MEMTSAGIGKKETIHGESLGVVSVSADEAPEGDAVPSEGPSLPPEDILTMAGVLASLVEGEATVVASPYDHTVNT